jgi:hypothetical protein
MGNSTGTYWIADWVGPSSGMDAVEKSEIFSSYWESNPDSSAVQSIACY